MSKMVAFVLGLFLIGTILSGVMSSGGGMLVTSLTANLAATGSTVTVRSTTNFLAQDYITIEGEKMLYSSKDATHFYIASSGRGYDGTQAKAHLTNAKVYSQEASILNEAMNVNPAAVKSNSGLFSVILVPYYFVTNVIPNIATFNFPFLQGDAAIIGYLFMACAAGLIVSFALSMLYVASGIIKLF